MKRNLYLKTISVEEAKSKFDDALESRSTVRPQAETVSSYEALGRTTFKPVFAKCCSPLFNAAAMDGIAVDSAKTRGASTEHPLVLAPEDYLTVDTGDPIRSPFDAVIMAEDIVESDDGSVTISSAVPGWNCVRPIGEDIVTGEMILPSNHPVRPVDIGVLLASGNIEVDVYKKPSVGIIPTGSEIIAPNENPETGNIIDSNSGMFAAEIERCGGIAKRYGIVCDDRKKITAAIRKALSENDIVVVNAGSSAGTEDYTVHILREIGDVIVHGVAMKPGKPVILAIASGKPVIGLPGYPVSAYLAMENFLVPVINRLTGKKGTDSEEHLIDAIVSKRIVSSLKHREYVRVRVGCVNGKYVCAPLGRGASAAMSLVHADGFLIIPQNSEGYEAGEHVQVTLYKSPAEIENTLVSIGSHDMMMDILSDLMSQDSPYHLSSTHVGSLGGLMALSRGETTIAPTHLLDEETGEYNIAYLRKLFGKDVCLIKGVERIQGIMVKPGNPLGVKDVSDLTKGRFVNRQRGAGTRVLLDYKLKKAGIIPEQISGYEKEVTTHMAVAASVKGDEIDFGMGVKSAADAMGLDFIEVGPEEYDFAVKKADLELPHVKEFISILKSDEFRKRLEAIGGYGFSRTGEIVEIK